MLKECRHSKTFILLQTFAEAVFAPYWWLVLVFSGSWWWWGCWWWWWWTCIMFCILLYCNICMYGWSIFMSVAVCLLHILGIKMISVYVCLCLSILILLRGNKSLCFMLRSTSAICSYFLFKVSITCPWCIEFYYTIYLNRFFLTFLTTCIHTHIHTHA